MSFPTEPRVLCQFTHHLVADVCTGQCLDPFNTVVPVKRVRTNRGQVVEAADRALPSGPGEQLTRTLHCGCNAAYAREEHRP